MADIETEKLSVNPFPSFKGIYVVTHLTPTPSLLMVIIRLITGHALMSGTAAGGYYSWAYQHLP